MRSHSLSAFALLLGGCCFGGAEALQQAAFQATFTQGCISSCVAEGGGATCQPYCECAAQQIQTRGQGARVVELEQQGRPEALLDEPWFAEVVGQCGSDYLDESFRVGCRGGCASEPNCVPYCECFLGQIRAGMTREQGTSWMFTSFRREPYPADVQARMDAAVQACVPAQ
jgi:hypothetical protein